MSNQDVRFLRQLSQDVVVQGRNHAAHHMHVFCLLLYDHVLKAAFGAVGGAAVWALALCCTAFAFARMDSFSITFPGLVLALTRKNASS